MRYAKIVMVFLIGILQVKCFFEEIYDTAMMEYIRNLESVSEESLMLSRCGVDPSYCYWCVDVKK